jgi:hypothetical protein
LITEKLIHDLVEKGHEWIVSQRDLHIEDAKELAHKDRLPLEPYFESHILDLAKIAMVDSIENPPFYPELKRLGIPELIDFTDMAGITFIDCILISSRVTHDQRSWTSLLFHEMVHVAQYHLLGAQRFAQFYVLGWAENGFEYRNIPLERQAYNLQRQFDQGRDVFSVAQILGQELTNVT